MTALYVNVALYALLLVSFAVLAREHYREARAGGGLGVLYLSALLGLRVAEYAAKLIVVSVSVAVKAGTVRLDTAPLLTIANVPVIVEVALSGGFLLAMRYANTMLPAAGEFSPLDPARFAAVGLRAWIRAVFRW